MSTHETQTPNYDPTLGVHYSFKYKHSSLCGGVRLGPEQQLNIPYISGRSLYEYLLCEKVNKSDSMVPSHKDRIANNTPGIAEYDNAIKDRMEVGCDTITSPRLSQILVAKDDSYISLTPLSPVSLSYTINEHIKSFVANGDTNIVSKNKNIRFNHGGANKQNVGTFPWYMTGQLYKAPQLDPNCQKLWKWYYGGEKIKIPANLIKTYETFLVKNRSLSTFSNKKNRNTEISLLHNMVDAILQHFSMIATELKNNQDILPTGDLTSPIITDALYPPLIDPTLRTTGWNMAFGSYLAHQLYAIESLGLDDNANLKLSSTIQKYLIS